MTVAVTDRTVASAGDPPESSSPLSSWVDLLEAAAGIVTVAGMIATPLLPQRGLARKVLSSVVVSGLFATTTANAARRWGTGRAVAAAGTTAVITAAVERFGTKTGFPFGRYSYTAALQPQVAHVPVIVPLAWFAMALPSREVASAVLGTEANTGTRLALGSAAMTAWDLFLDPQMVGEGYWGWVRRGVYRGIPLSNYIGWFITGIGVMGLLEAIVPPTTTSNATATSNAAATTPGDPHLVGTYAYMAVMETLGFAKYFRDPLVALVGGIGMVPIAVAAVLRKTGT